MIKTTTQLTINQKIIGIAKYSWAEELFLELDNGDSIRIGCADDVFINGLNTFMNLYRSNELDKLPEFTRQRLKDTMTKLYNYFNQHEDA